MLFRILFIVVLSWNVVYGDELKIGDSSYAFYFKEQTYLIDCQREPTMLIFKRYKNKFFEEYSSVGDALCEDVNGPVKRTLSFIKEKLQETPDYSYNYGVRFFSKNLTFNKLLEKFSHLSHLKFESDVHFLSEDFKATFPLIHFEIDSIERTFHTKEKSFKVKFTDEKLANESLYSFFSHTLNANEFLNLSQLEFDYKKERFVNFEVLKKPKEYPLVIMNTYDINEYKECIDGLVWIKKYGKKSGDSCPWILTEKSIPIYKDLISTKQY